MPSQPIQVTVTDVPSALRKPSATAPVRAGARLYLKFFAADIEIPVGSIPRPLSALEQTALRRLAEYLGETIIYLSGSSEE